jgi:RNA polymerase sigma-70 factor (ECF subfamily)
LSKSEIEEKKMLKACLQGNVIAQRQLYNKYAATMYGICLRYTKIKHEAADLLQDGMFTVFKDLNSYKYNGSLEGWIRKVIVNTNLQHLRKKRINFDYEYDIGDIQQKDDSYLEIYRKFEREALINLVRKLPEGCQVIFNLYVIEELTHKEIAEQLSISIGTSKSQLSKARRLLKEQLSKIQEKESYL